jgi:multidrug resistance efflux pump
MKLILTLVAIVLLSVSGAVAAFLIPDQETITLSGLVQAREVKNASRFGGRVLEVLVQEGDVVEKGQRLVVFDDLELTSKVAEARAALIQAEAREGLLVDGVDVSDLEQASSQVKQAQEQLNMLTRGPRPEEITQASAKVQEAQSRFNSVKATYENSNRMFEEGIISQQKLNDIKNQLEAAQSGLSSAQATLKLLKSGAQSEQVNIARSQVAAAKAQYDKLRKGSKPDEIKIASASVQQAQSVLTALEAQLSEMTVVAPISGVVTIMNVSEGELVPPGRPVVSIIDYNNLWTDVFVPEASLRYLHHDQAVVIQAPVYGKTPFKGRVAFVSPKSEFVPGGGRSSAANSSEQATYRVKVEIDKKAATPSAKGQLHPGMNVNVLFDKKE